MFVCLGRAHQALGSSRSIYSAAVWYYHHCQDKMPIVMVTEDEEAIQQYGSETEGVFVISFKVFPAVYMLYSLPNDFSEYINKTQF